MNLLPTYEQWISDRQDDIEIPDMSDAIWGRVEAMLDVEMPVNDPPATSPHKPFFNNPAVWITGAGITAIIIVLFILLKSPRTEPSTPGNTPQQTEPAVKPDTIMNEDSKPPDKPKPAPRINTPAKTDKHTADTAANRTFNKVETDSLLKKPPAIIAPPLIIKPPGVIIDSSMNTKPRKKYGVTVSDSDYRFDVKPKN
jgi:hypothetical protein